MSERNCVTHHYACDCREEAHAKRVAELEAEVERLRTALEAERDLAEYPGWLDAKLELETVRVERDALRDEVGRLRLRDGIAQEVFNQCREDNAAIGALIDAVKQAESERDAALEEVERHQGEREYALTQMHAEAVSARSERDAALAVVEAVRGVHREIKKAREHQIAAHHGGMQVPGGTLAHVQPSALNMIERDLRHALSRAPSPTPAQWSSEPPTVGLGYRCRVCGEVSDINPYRCCSCRNCDWDISERVPLTPPASGGDDDE